MMRKRLRTILTAAGLAAAFLSTNIAGASEAFAYAAGSDYHDDNNYYDDYYYDDDYYEDDYDDYYYGSSGGIASLIDEYNLSDENVHIADTYDVLTSSEEEELESMCEELEDELDVNFLIVTGYDVSSYASDTCQVILRQREFSAKGCTVFFVDFKLRDFWIESYTTGSDKYDIDENIIDYIIDEITSDMTAGNYYSAFETFLELSAKYMEKDDGFNPNNLIFKWWFDILVAMIISTIIVVPSVVNAGGKVTVNERTYIKNPESAITNARDDYIRTSVTKTRIESNSGGSHGGGGHSGGGGGGHSHGGGGHF